MLRSKDPLGKLVKFWQNNDFLLIQSFRRLSRETAFFCYQFEDKMYIKNQQ